MKIDKTLGMVAIAMALMMAFSGLVTLATSVRAEDSFQDPFAIYGTVYDKSDNPVTGATVEVKNMRTGQTLDTVTDDDGKYTVVLNSMPSGYQNGDSIKVTVAKGTSVGSAVDEVDTSSYGTSVDVTLGVTSRSNDNDNLFLGLQYWVWTVIVVGLILVGALIYVYAKRDELGLGK